MHHDNETVALTALPRELKAYSGQDTPGGYRKLWGLVVNGQVPAEQVNGRYRIRRAELPSIATTLGLSPTTAAPTETFAAA